MAGEVQQAQRKGELDPRRGSRLRRAKGPEQERKAGGMRIPLGRQAPHGLNHPRALAEPLEVLPEPAEGPTDIEVIEPQEVAPFPLEPDGLAPGEELKRPAEAGSDAPRAPGDGGELAEVAREQGHETVILPEIAGAQDDALGAEERHVGESQEVRR